VSGVQSGTSYQGKTVLPVVPLARLSCLSYLWHLSVVECHLRSIGTPQIIPNVILLVLQFLVLKNTLVEAERINCMELRFQKLYICDMQKYVYILLLRDIWKTPKIG